jgi:hypothetical protein
MKKLIARLAKAVKGVLSGFDRIVFKGSILPLGYEEGAMSFLRGRRVLNRDYKQWMQTQTDALVKAVDQYAREQSGWMHIRLQTWFPYHIQVAMNGREWLRRRLEARHVDFLRQGNKFLHIDDFASSACGGDRQQHSDSSLP